jgi:oxygen-independent coproporphyrinogen-3 oxidase
LHLYLHVPFCARRCTYCDFSIAVRRDVPAADFVSAIARELAVRSLGGDVLDTVYAGGGTPSKLGGDGVARLLDAVRARFTIDANAEVTIEANPEDVTPAAARAWREAGVNRLSLGSQSFDDRVLAWMHRTHDAAQIGRAVHVAREAGVDNLSLDLIFALPESLERDWARDLDQVVALSPQHLSLYGLTVEHATPLGRWAARGDVRELPEERWADEFLRAHATLAAAGYAHYEVSNYARDGARARHNEAYWRDRAYLGVGPSAHGFDGATRRWNEPAYAHWLARVSGGEDPVSGSELLTPEQRLAERVYLGLRTDRGYQLERPVPPSVQQWVDAGWASIDSTLTLSLSPTGWMRLDALASALTSALTRLTSRY